MELCTSTNIYFERRYEAFIPVAECIRRCADAGYRKLDFGFAELALKSAEFHGVKWEEEILGYKKLAKSLSIEFLQAHATIFDFCRPPETAGEQRELFLRSIRGAALLEVPWIVVHPSTGVKGGEMDPDTHKRNEEFFREYGEYAKSLGTGLAIENMWGRTREGLPHYGVCPEELLRLIEDVGSDRVRICWDVEHGSIEELDQKKALSMLSPYLVATHISDENGPDNIHILPYTGRMDWDEILNALADINYCGAFNFEIQHYLPGMPKELVPEAMALSFRIGGQMVERLAQLKRERGYE